MDDLGTRAREVQPVLVSVEAQRDGADLAECTLAFAILGRAGDEAPTRLAAGSFDLVFERGADLAAPDGSSMARSSALDLIGPEGDWLRQCDYGTPAAEIVADLQPSIWPPAWPPGRARVPFAAAGRRAG